MPVSRRSLLQLVLLVLLVSGASRWWATHQDASLGRQVAALAQAGDIRMISSQSCAICAVARDWLAQNRVSFSECLIERDAVCRADFDALGGPGTPVLVVRGKPQLGFSPDRLLLALGRPG